MRPYPEELLRALQSGVAAHFAPELRSDYARAQFAFSMLLFTIAQRDYDTAVPDLLDANRELRALLADATRALSTLDFDAVRGGREALEALPPPTPSLKLADLRSEHEALRAALGALAPLIEPAADVAWLAPLRDVRAKAFAYLAADAKRRVVPILTM